MIHFISNQITIEESTNYDKSSVEECLEYCNDKIVLGLDIETTKKYNKYEMEGLDPYTSDIVMLQIGDIDNQFIIDTRNVDIRALLPIFTDPKIIKVGHNIKFEYKHILHKYGVRLKNVYDTQVVEQILFNGYFYKNGLKDLNHRYLNMEVDKSTRLEFLTIGAKPFTEKQIKYGAEDVFNPLKIREKQLELIEEADVNNCVVLENQFVEVLGEIEYRGINFNSEKWLTTYEQNLELFNKQKIVLDEFVFERFSDSRFVEKQLDLFSSDPKCTIKWTSSKQVVDFFKELGICPEEVSKSTGKLSYTVNAKVLMSSLNTMNKDIEEYLSDFIKKYLKFKELEQTCTTFGKSFLKNVNPISKRVHTNYSQVKNTGRISSGGPNLQNIPSAKEFREAFDAPPGFEIVNADYSGQENICLANASLDPDILNFYYEGHSDMHSYNARKIFTELTELSLPDIKKLHPDKRQIAKSVSFALAYGGNGYTISNNLGVSPEEGERIYDSYFAAFPKLKEFFDKTIEESMSRGYIIVDDVTNRRFYFKDWKLLNKYKEDKEWKKYYTIKGKYERACLNYIIQGAAGSITKYAAILFRNWILDSNLQNVVFITNLVHDEINVESYSSYSTIVAEGLEHAMEKAGSLWCKTIPLKADAVIGQYWSH